MIVPLPSFRRLLLALGLGAATASAAMAGTLVLKTTPYSVNPGGAFSASNSGLDTSHYAASALHNGGFLTFCLEYNEYINSGQTYHYNDDLQYYAHKGGVGGQTEPDRDYLSLGTAWLYSEFARGNLGAVNFGALQKAFWMLENEITFATNAYVTLVQNQFGQGWNTTAGGAYGVSVLNLQQKDNQGRWVHKQSQLYFGGLPKQVPDAGSTALLLVLGVGAMAALRRKRAA
jgi:hypothetical protein